MRFINPYVEIYYEPENLIKGCNLHFYKEVIWVFLKNLDSKLKLYQHRINIKIYNIEPPYKTMNFGSIYQYNVVIEDSLNGLNEFEKRIKLLDLIYESFLYFGQEMNWDLNVIENSYLQSKQEINSFEYCTKPKLARDRKKTGKLKLELQGNLLTFKVELNYKNDIKKEFFLFETSEDNLSWSRMFKDYGWLDNKKFGLKFLSGDLWIIVDIETGKIEELKTPKKYDINKIEQYITELKKPVYNKSYN